MATAPPLPPGFTLDGAPAGAPTGTLPPLPDGFTLDQGAAPPVPGNEDLVAPAPDNDMAQHVQRLQAQERATGAIQNPVMRSVAQVSQVAAGAIDAALTATTGLVNFIPGLLSGGVGNLLTAGGEAVAKGVTAVDRAARGVPTSLPTDPSIGDAAENPLTGKYMRAVVHQPKTPQGREYTEQYVDPVMQQVVVPLTGHAPDLAAMHEGAAPAARAVADKARVTASRAGEVVGESAAKVLGVDPEKAKVAKTATELKYPIDVRPDQVVENAKFTKLAGQAAADVPLSGSKVSSNQTNFTRNVLDLINPEETDERLTPINFDKAMTRSGEGIGEITSKTPVPLDTKLTDGIEALRSEVLAKGTADDRHIIGNWIDEIKNKAGDDGMIDGAALREINSEIGEQARANPDNDLGRRLNVLQDTIQDAVERNIKDPEDAQRLKDFRRQYAYGKMVEPLVAKTIDGKISPQALMARVTATKRGKHFMARSMGGPIGDLAKVGQLIKEPSSSLTTERGLVYGVGLGGGAYIEPHTAGAAYAAANAYNRLGPKLTRAMVRGREQPLPPAERPSLPPPGPDTSPGAGGPRGGSGGPPEGPLGDLTPDWTTTPGAGGPRGGGGIEPEGLVPALGEPQPGPRGPRSSTNKAGKQVPLVPGKPGVEETMVAGPKSELANEAATGRAMQSDNAALARRQQAEKAAAEAQSPAVKQVIGEHAAKLKAEETARERARVNAEDAAALEKAARATDDPHLQARLLKRANELRAEEKIPVGNATEVPMGHGVDNSKPKGKIPTGKATEITPERITPENPEIPVGEATEITPEYIEADRQWRAEHRLGEQDADRARTVAKAHAIDPERVEALAQQYDKSPTRFDREIQNIIEEKRNADEAQRAAGSGQGDAKGPAGAAAPVSPDERGQGVRDTRAQGDEPVPAARSGAAGERKPEPDAAVHAADEQPGADRVPAAGAQRDEAAAPGGQDAPRAQGKPLVARNGLEIRERPDGTGFDAYRDGKKVGHLNDNLKRGQAEALGESANVDMVKVDPSERGKGTGKALYDAFNEKHGGRIMPSGKTEPAAWKLWKRNYPEKVDAFVKQEAQRIKDGADRDMVLGNIKDPEVAQRVADAAGKPPPDPFETDLAKEGDERDVTETPAFKRWSGGAKVVGMHESRTRDFVGDEPVVVELVHGTVRDFDAFDRTRANPESDLGAGFYFTNTPSDVAHNYATAKGADLQVKVERLGDVYANQVMFGDNADPKMVQRFVDETGFTPEQMKLTRDDDEGVTHNAENYSRVREAAEKFAQEDLAQHGGATMPVYVRFKKPLVLGGAKETFLDYETPYDAARDEHGEPTGQLATFLDAFKDELNSGKYEVEPREVEHIMGKLHEELMERGALDDEGIKASELEQALHQSGSIDDLVDNEGSFAGREAMRQAFENAGYDGIIDQGANKKFGPYRRFGRAMAGVTATTKHFVAFEPTQVKSSLGNRGTFDPLDANILHAEGGPIWRSPLKDFIDGAKMEKGTPEQWRGFLKNAKGVKAEEIKWSGIDDYLRLREGSEDPVIDKDQGDLFGVPSAKKSGVTKAEIQDFLAKGGVQITETQKGGPWKGLDVPERLGKWLDSRGHSPGDVSTMETSEWRQWADDFAGRARESRTRAELYKQQDESGSAAVAEKQAMEYDLLHEQAVQMLEASRVSDKPPPVKFGTWVKPGGSNYRELLLKLDSNKDKPFDRSHWDQDNNVAHLRATDRFDAQGRRGLHIEEVQSDWAQQGRKHGIDEPTPAKAPTAPYEPVDKLPEGWSYEVDGRMLRLRDPEDVSQWSEEHGDRAYGGVAEWPARDPASHMAHAVEMYNKIGERLAAGEANLHARQLVRASKDTKSPPVPNAPYISSTDAWASLVLKRAVKLAADEDYAFVTFANGKQNAEMYNGLIQRISKIQYDPEEGHVYAYDHGGSEVLNKEVEPTVEALADIIGREPAEKLVKAIENGAGEPSQGWDADEAYDPEHHGQYEVHEDEEVESRHYLSDDSGNHVLDRFGDPHYFESDHEARSALRDYSIEENSDDQFVISDHEGRTLKDSQGNFRRFDTEEEAKEALEDFTVEEEEGERRWHLYGPDGEHVETYDSYRDAQRDRSQYQEEHEDRINGEERENDPLRPTISGLDLLIGDEGMREFYDRILPQNAKRVVNQLGGSGIKRIEVPSLEGNEPAREPWNQDRAEMIVKNGGEIIVDVKAGVSGGLTSTHVESPAALDALLKSGQEFANFSEVRQPQVGFDITPAMKEATQNGVPLFKNAEQKTAAAPAVPEGRQPVGTREALDQSLRDKFGSKLIDGLIDQGVLKYGLQRDEQPPGSRVKAVMRQKGEQPAATLYWDRLTADEAPGVLMHELGEHYGIARILGNERYRIMLNDLADLHAQRDPEVARAWDHVRDNYTGEGTSSKLTEGDTVFLREVAARLVETAPDQHFVRRIINDIRAFFYTHFGTTMGNRVDGNLIRGLAAAALRKASTGELPRQIPGYRGNEPTFRPFVSQSEGGHRPPVRRLFQPQQQPQP
jgi:GNAT superfamily N-acetyltransferase